MNSKAQMIFLDYQSRVPIYEQIIRQFERYIILGLLKPQDQVPPIRELASTLGINPNTVKQAYKIMEEKKMIVTFSTKGTFIANDIEFLTTNKIEDQYSDINNAINELNKMGVNPEEIKKRIDIILKK